VGLAVAVTLGLEVWVALGLAVRVTVGLAVAVTLGLEVWVALRLAVIVTVGLTVCVSLEVCVRDGIALDVGDWDWDGVMEMVWDSVSVLDRVALSLALSVGDELTLDVAEGVDGKVCVSVAVTVRVGVLEPPGLSVSVNVCSGETVLLGEGEKKGVDDMTKVGKTNVSRGVGILKKGLSGSLGFMRPVGPFSQKGNAWPKPGSPDRKITTMKNRFMSRHSAYVYTLPC
jgi:hypothetical protein